MTLPSIKAHTRGRVDSHQQMDSHNYKGLSIWFLNMAMVESKEDFEESEKLNNFLTVVPIIKESERMPAPLSHYNKGVHT